MSGKTSKSESFNEKIAKSRSDSLTYQDAKMPTSKRNSDSKLYVTKDSRRASIVYVRPTKSKKRRTLDPEIALKGQIVEDVRNSGDVTIAVRKRFALWPTGNEIIPLLMLLKSEVVSTSYRPPAKSITDEPEPDPNCPRSTASEIERRKLPDNASEVARKKLVETASEIPKKKLVETASEIPKKKLVETASEIARKLATEELDWESQYKRNQELKERYEKLLGMDLKDRYRRLMNINLGSFHQT